MRSQEALDELANLLDSARTNLERECSRERFSTEERSLHMEMAVALEPSRFRLAQRQGRQLNEDEAYVLYKQIRDKLRKVLQTPLFHRYGKEFLWTNYRLPIVRSSQLREALDLQKPISFTDGISSFLYFLEEELRTGEPPIFQPELELEATSALRRVLPAQQPIAPVQFDIDANRLVIKHQRAVAARHDRANVEAARVSLLAAGRRIREAIEESNNDIRLGQTLDEIQAALNSEQDIINLGLMNFVLDAVRESLEAELANPMNGMLKAHSVNISMFVAQFPEWQRFNEQAERIALDAEAISGVKRATEQLIRELRARADTVDPEVPKTIAALNALIADPSRASKRAVLAVIRSVENLIARAYQALAEFAEKTARDTLDGLSKAISKNAVKTLVCIALVTAAPLIPATVSLKSSAWVKAATEIVKHQMEKLERD